MIYQQVPLPVPCYNFVPLTGPTVVLLRSTSGIPSSLDVMGSEYKAQGGIHGYVADQPLLAIPTS